MRILIAAVISFLIGIPVVQGAVITFEGIPDSTLLTNQVTGATFSSALVLSAGIGLNEFEFPPKSGSNVVIDDTGPLTIQFLGGGSSFSAYFTYAEPLT